MSAAIPKEAAEKGRSGSPNESKGPLSHGRGGAGNIGHSVSDFDPVNIHTPTLKGDVFTTGRGGSGNMAKNTDPEATRLAQDVIGVPLRQTTSATHVGRGGSANIFNPSSAISEVTFKASGNTALKTANENATIPASNTATNTGPAIAITHQETAEQKRARLAHERSIKGFANVGKEWLMGKFAFLKRGRGAQSVSGGGSVVVRPGTAVNGGAGNVMTRNGMIEYDNIGADGCGRGALGEDMAGGGFEAGEEDLDSSMAIKDDDEDEDAGGRGNGIMKKINFSASTTALDARPTNRLKSFKSTNFRRG